MPQATLENLATGRRASTKCHISLANLVKSLFCTKSRAPDLAGSLLGIVQDSGQTLESIKAERLLKTDDVQV